MVTLADLVTQGLAQAMRVLDLVKLESGSHLYVMTYQNGRENGFAVRGWNRMWVFSEDRRSDYMVLYVGDSHEFHQGNIPSEAVYAQKRLFASVEELVKVLTEELEQESFFIKAKIAQDKAAIAR